MLRRYLLWAAIVVVLGIGVFVGVRWALKPVPQSLRLVDGSEIFFLSDTKIVPASGYPQPRDIHVDGDAFFKVTPQTRPLTVRSRLLILTVTGDTAFRITAYSKETGEQVEVLRGHVVAHKSYPSSYMEPDTLTGGQMVMINRTIDLMEKENFNPAELQGWSAQLVAATKAKEKR